MCVRARARACTCGLGLLAVKLCTRTLVHHALVFVRARMLHETANAAALLLLTGVHRHNIMRMHGKPGREAFEAYNRADA